MRRLLLVAGLVLIAFATTATAASFSVPETVLFSFIGDADFDQEPPSGDWTVDWAGHGEEHVDHGCEEGDVTWLFVLNRRPPDAEMFLLDATFTDADDVPHHLPDVGGEPHGQGATGSVHFTLATDASYTLVAATVRLDTDPHPTTRLLLSGAECEEASISVESEDDAPAAGATDGAGPDSRIDKTAGPETEDGGSVPTEPGADDVEGTGDEQNLDGQDDPRADEDASIEHESDDEETGLDTDDLDQGGTG